ncbi:MAG TPA: hypothetical protein DCF63_05785 [Planctomycetaceae bacterium]|nr:hypothetical protein [Planctomycetaceae bacterium]
MLSLERIEIVDGRLTIVTELAEGSLLDRLEKARRQGSPGMPRAELLDFMRDTADALDFLAQKHSLQHLDVKPGNLLIIANRVKVADFGLVKDLHEVDDSLVGGLTPIYSAPEVFDGRPDYRSDQYSLAIVFMELLTGRVPFNGRTAGELARQHLNQAPKLEALPPADRNIIRRALSKNPLDRYPSCRQFVDQLLKVRSTALPTANKLEKAATPNTSTVNPTHQFNETQGLTSVGQSLFQPAIPLEQLTDQWVNSRCLFIGLGGQGVLSLAELRSDLIHNVDDRLTCDDHQWLAIDTSPSELEIVTDGSVLQRLPNDSAVRLPIQAPQAYRRCDPIQFAPLSRRWMYNIPRSLRTDGVRPIATLSLIANYQPLTAILEQKVAKLIQQHQQDSTAQTPIRVYVVASLHGGTGAALLSEMGFLLRKVFAQLAFSNYRLCGVVSAATTSNSRASSSLPAANALVTLSELTHWMDPDVDKPSIDYLTNFNTSTTQPFDWVTMIDGGLYEDRIAAEQNPRNLARHIALDCQSLAAAALAESRTTGKPTAQGWLRTAYCASVQPQYSWTPQMIAQWSCIRSLASLCCFLSKSNSQFSQTGSSTNLACTLPEDQLPLTDQACDELSRRMLQEMGFHEDMSQVLNNPDSISQWARRLAQDDSVRRQQFVQDLNHWQRSILRIARMRLYNWSQMERILQTVIQGFESYAKSHVPQLAQLFAQFPDMMGDSSDMIHRVRKYLSELATLCGRYYNNVSSGVQQFADRLASWHCDLDSALKSKIPGYGERVLVPILVQLLCARMSGAIDGKLQAQLQIILQDIPEELRQSLPAPAIVAPSSGTQDGGADANSSATTANSQVESIRHPGQLLRFAEVQLATLCREMDISEQDIIRDNYHHTPVTFEELGRQSPMFAANSGSIYRLLITGQQQIAGVDRQLAAQGIRQQTSLLPAPPSLGTHLVCDAVGLNFAQIVTGLWRPSGATMNLADRLRTRVDVVWPPIVKLFDPRPESACSAKQDSIQQNSLVETPSVPLDSIPLSGTTMVISPAAGQLP